MQSTMVLLGILPTNQLANMDIHREMENKQASFHKRQPGFKDVVYAHGFVSHLVVVDTFCESYAYRKNPRMTRIRGNNRKTAH